jgi:hypothetical protein
MLYFLPTKETLHSPTLHGGLMSGIIDRVGCCAFRSQINLVGIKTRRNLMRSLISCPMVVALVCLLSRSFLAIPGVEGTFEYAFDAPWRIEPTRAASGRLEYGLIPIQLSIHDAVFVDRDGVSMLMRLGKFGKFQNVTITEGGFSKVFGIADLSEIEMTDGAWPWPVGLRPPVNTICRVWKGQDPEPCSDIGKTSEWHAILWYKPRSIPTPDGYLSLTIDMKVDIEVNETFKGKQVVPLQLRNQVRVKFASDSLPRFDDRSLYGDLHYHSQGTDNEGESAYNYRGVVRAMGAIGLDFVFATEHASNSEQIVDADMEIQGEVLPTHGVITRISSKGDVLRDMSRQRFDFYRDHIWEAGGVNTEAAVNGPSGRRPQGIVSHGVVPQIFLGGELDAIPEWDRQIREIPYGNGLLYKVNNLNNGWTLELNTIESQSLSSKRIRRITEAGGKPGTGTFEDLWERVGNEYLIRDVQGIKEYDYGREHLVYLPKTSAKEISVNEGEFTFEKDSSFIPSYTGLYGGGGRRLTDGWKGRRALLKEVEQKGYVFLAHHLNDPSGSNGPDGPPWPRSMLEKAFRSEAVLGLEFWNENGRIKKEVKNRNDGSRDHTGGTSMEIGYERCDWISLWGTGLGGVFGRRKCDSFPTNGMVRGFQHKIFQLNIGDFPTLDLRTIGIERKLHHGAASWDRMNHWGLDTKLTRDLPWLERNKPRRVFMAGGSDAHGDFNYRRSGYLLGTDELNTTVIGSPRNLVFISQPPDGRLRLDSSTMTPLNRTVETAKRYSQEQVVNALKEGSFAITDGPALRIAIDTNENGQIDDSDVNLGGVAEIPFRAPMKVKLLVEWLSTSEFGQVSRIDLYVGTRTSKYDNNLPGETKVFRTYAPEDHGVRDAAWDTPQGVPLNPAYSSGGLTYREMKDGYWLDPTGLLRIMPTRENMYGGIRVIELDLDRFEAMQGEPGQRLFVRAFARTLKQDDVPRYAYTNPIWIIRQPLSLRPS